MSGSDLTRRTLLGGLAAGGSALALVGCGDESTPSGDVAPSTPDGSGAPSTPDGGGGDDSAGDALVATADVAVGGGVVLGDRKVVVTQPAEGDFHAFTAVCTHAGCVVAEVVDSEIVCGCHGSRFSATDGSVVAGPAAAPLAEVPVTVEGGEVVSA